ncbi:MAG: choice-of-anchor tandem repeat GloVer-containing protein [Bryobacteraceae bacterium]|jgi:uncharacterized repeat protein (TIGR03803 family)
MGKLNRGTRACAVFAWCTAAAFTLSAQTFVTLHTFVGTDGANPYAALIQADNGDGYGTTENGGAYGSGTIFKITPQATLTTLHSFCSQSACADGAYPLAGLVQAPNGYFYGTTVEGGANGLGTVFQVTPSALITLHSFDGTDGQTPWAGLAQGSDGNFYGTTANGGSGNNGGTVFKITPGGVLTTLYTFCEKAVQAVCVDGQHPQAVLVEAANEEFYGTTSAGGANNGGTVFEVTSSGTLTTLYSFCAQSGCTDGELPNAGLVWAADGNFYGTTTGGGANGAGTVFKITSTGTLTTLYSFCSQTGCADGASPDAALVQATDGNFYGTTSAGGATGGGTVFEIVSSGALTTLHSFTGSNAVHQAGIIQGTTGGFFGATWDGGTYNYGTVYGLSVGLGAFVKLLPPSGAVGTPVRILGTNLTGTTSVSFGGTAAVFAVVSSSEITTTVPAGASSGEVQVVTPVGTLSSNVVFRLLP